MEVCIFAKISTCKCNESTALSKIGQQRLQTIVNCSKAYEDDLFKIIEDLSASETDRSVFCHKTCVSTYTSKQHVSRVLKRKGGEATCSIVSPKKKRRSSMPDFDFRKHCLFCGEDCFLEKDPKNPKRWRRAFLCRTVGDVDMKQDILSTCLARGDKWSEEVRLRVSGAVSDLHAADARYHTDCKANFISPKSVRLAATGSSTSAKTVVEDYPLEELVGAMLNDRSHVWNSIELFQTYTAAGGTKLVRRNLVEALVSRFGNEVLVLSASGVASIVVFKHSAPALLKVVSDHEESDNDLAIKKIAKEIENETKSIDIDKSLYDTRLSKETIETSVSSTLMQLLAKVSSKLDYSPPAYLVGSIITNTLTNSPTQLQIALGVLVRNSKALVSQLNAFGVTCSYDEVLRFKKSAAMAATSTPVLQGISDSKSGLIQVIVDNFDADISSQNGKLSTHSLAMLVTQPEGEPSEESDTFDKGAIRRVDKNEMKQPIDYDVNIKRYNGPKKPDMPAHVACKQVLPLKALAEMAISSKRAHETDLGFFTEIVNNDKCPEFNGYNTQTCREQGHAVKPKTKALYLPLIDMTPSDPDTIMTALSQAQVITSKCGQDFVVFTGDLQLYRVAVHILWAYPVQFDNIILRLGGMHTLMSFVGSIGTLMAGSGLFELMESTFGGVQKMMTGKKFPQNVRALRIVAEELLRPMLLSSKEDDISELENTLTDISSKSRTSRLWFDCVIKAVFIMMMYIRAEREGDWCLHLVAVKAMIPYFFAAGHVHYARYGLYYLRSMESMPEKCREKFMKGDHIMRHVPGRWNGIWSDMYIETTFMRYGHGNRGIIGITLKPETLKVWSLSLHVCSRLEQDLASLIDPDEDAKHVKHKEEMKGRIAADGSDRDSIRRKLQECIDPFKPDEHPTEVVNIVLGRIAGEKVNVDQALEIGLNQQREFESKWPQSFHEKISRSVITQAESLKYIKVGETKVFDTELIYIRVIGLQASSREVDVKQLLSYELSPVPTSMFLESGEMQVAKAKSTLKRVLQKEVSVRCLKKEITTLVIDGSAILYVLRWPQSTGTVGDFVLKYRHFVERHLLTYDVYLVFDRYIEYSTKSVTRAARGAQINRVHSLTSDMPIPPQKVVLTVPENKRQLVALIVEDLCNNTVFPTDADCSRKLIITGEDPTPIELTKSCSIRREDLRTTHEEADNILAQQMALVAREPNAGVSVISDDTDVFVMLLYFYQKLNLTNVVIMDSPVQERTTVDIGATVNEHKDIIPDLPAAHALTGSDTTAGYFGIGKGTAVKVLRSKMSTLKSVGDISCQFENVLQEATKFIAACYSVTMNETDMSSVRQKVWAARVGKAHSCAPKLCSLPPTSEAFSENVKRVHLQACIWKQAIDQDPPQVNPELFGWEKNESLRTLVPVMLPKNVPLAPQEVLKLIKCSCESQMPCDTLRCRCNSSRLSCTIFCACQGSTICCNEQTKLL